MTDIRSALEEAFNEADKPETEEVKAVATDAEAKQTEETAAEPAEGRARDEQGRFAPKVATEAKEAHEPVPEPAPAPPARNPFSSWKPDAQTALMKAERGEALTPEELKLLRVEAERRESDFHKGVSEFKTHSERAKAYDQAIAPYQQHLQRLGVDAPTAINALMKADVTLRTSDPATKAQYFAQLAREYGIDLAQVQNPAPVDPQTQFLTQQLNELRQQQQMWQNQVQQQEQMRVQNELQQFATADKKHFDAVRNDMADLLETGKAKNLQEAYDMAVLMRPDVRQTLIEQQLADAQRKALEQAQAQRAKTAAVGVKGSSPIGAGSQPVTGSLRDVIAAQFADN
jgi:gas vesicle protein